MANVTDTRNDQLKTWIDPEVSELNLPETAVNPGRGGQPSRYPDCTRS